MKFIIFIKIYSNNNYTYIFNLIYDYSDFTQ